MSEEEPQKRKPRRRREAMPDALKERAQNANRKHAKRFPAPEVEIVPSEEGWFFESPYRSADEAEWWRLLGEAFGTRTKSVIAVFMGQVARLVGTQWDQASGRAMPHQEEIQAALSIVAAMKPQNEAEAAQAAQAFALHMASMKVGTEVAQRSWVDPRQANALANLVKAYSGVMDSMKRGRRTGSTKQTIVVRKDVRIFNDNRQVNVTPRGGGSAAAEQPDGAKGITRARPCRDANSEGRTGVIESRPALPSPPQADLGAVSGASDAEQDGLPQSRGKVEGR